MGCGVGTSHFDFLRKHPCFGPFGLLLLANSKKFRCAAEQKLSQLELLFCWQISKRFAARLNQEIITRFSSLE
jgi:hypothetical protein